MKKTLNTSLIKVCLIGIKGLPARYGGFETFAENLVMGSNNQIRWSVYGEEIDRNFSIRNNFKRIIIPFKANGFQSIFHDAIALIHAIFWEKPDKILVLGYSGSWVLPFIKPFHNIEIIINIDGLEWRRNKYNAHTKYVLYLLEQFALTFSNKVIADNSALLKHIKYRYHKKVTIIEYGGDHPFRIKEKDFVGENNYYAVSRIEPENNVKMILQAFENLDAKLTYVGNWKNSNYSRKLFDEYSGFENIKLVGPEYDREVLTKLRINGGVYIHGHSVGGTNPSLAEAIHCNRSFICFDCDYNRVTMDNNGSYFYSLNSLREIIENRSVVIIDKEKLDQLRHKYSWERIINNYLALIDAN